MVTLDTNLLSQWLSLYFWPLARVLALISTAPVLSDKQVSRRVKLGLGLLITMLIAPELPATNLPIFSFASLWLIVQQILIGAALGMTMQFAFAAIRIAGEVVGMGMGLSFATFYDPLNGPNSPIIARILNTLTMLLFLTVDGHLWMISLVADSFHTLPIQSEPLNSLGFLELAKVGSMIFLNGLILALPLATLLMTINLALGVLNRLTPQLSVFVIGFPITLGIGLIIMEFMIQLLGPFCERLFADFYNLMTQIVGGMS